MLLLGGCADDPTGQASRETADRAAVSQPCAPTSAVGTRSIDTPDGERSYVVSGPTEVVRGVVVDFHGTGGTPASEDAFTRLSTLGPGAGLLVIQPQGLGTPTRWTVPGISGPDDQAFVASMLDIVRTEQCLAEDIPVFATGISAGAGMSMALACAGSVTAAAPVAGAALVRRCPEGDPVGILSFHGTTDQAVPYDGVPGWEDAEQRPRGFFVGAVEPVLASFAARNGCSAEIDDEVLGPMTTERRWRNCPADAPVRLVRVEGGGHNLPGTQPLIDSLGVNDQIGPSTAEIDAAAMIVEFFVSFT